MEIEIRTEDRSSGTRKILWTNFWGSSQHQAGEVWLWVQGDYWHVLGTTVRFAQVPRVTGEPVTKPSVKGTNWYQWKIEDHRGNVIYIPCRNTIGPPPRMLDPGEKEYVILYLYRPVENGGEINCEDYRIVSLNLERRTPLR